MARHIDRHVVLDAMKRCASAVPALRAATDRGARRLVDALRRSDRRDVLIRSARCAHVIQAVRARAVGDRPRWSASGAMGEEAKVPAGAAESSIVSHDVGIARLLGPSQSAPVGVQPPMPRLLPIFVVLATVGAWLVAPLAASTQDVVQQHSYTVPLYTRPIENVFATGEGLYPGLIVRSPNRQWLMTLQLDGNLVVYAADLRPRWQTGTSVRPRNAGMNEDGEFALYAHDGTKVWSTGTNAPGARLILENTGRLVVVAPDGSVVWVSDRSDAAAAPPTR